MSEQPRENKRLNRIVAGALTVAFLGFIFVATGVMLARSGGDTLKAMRSKSNLQPYYTTDHPGPLDRLAAKINVFTGAIADNMFLKEEMGYVNSAFQYALGKKVINTGSQNMIRLTTGHLYDLQDYKPLAENAQGILDLAENELAGIPFLFVYEHPTLYDDAMLPEGYEALDHSAEMADEVVSALREGGVRVLDSRDVLPNSGYPLDELLLVTDQHWSTLAAITMAQSIAGELNDMTGTALDPALLDRDALNTQVHEKLFMGKYGQRVGTGLVTPDDIIEYWPKYDTFIVRDTKRVESLEHAEGSFREVATRAERLEPDPGRSWNTLAYTYYGQVEAYNNFHNDDAEPFTLLLLKDSYSAPIGTFLSLLATDVVTVDLRRNVEPLEWWVETWHPDAVVMAYSLQMLRDDEYEFGG